MSLICLIASFRIIPPHLLCVTRKSRFIYIIVGNAVRRTTLLISPQIYRALETNTRMTFTLSHVSWMLSLKSQSHSTPNCCFPYIKQDSFLSCYVVVPILSTAGTTACLLMSTHSLLYSLAALHVCENARDTCSFVSAGLTPILFRNRRCWYRFNFRLL
jgi:hypothetical protein